MFVWVRVCVCVYVCIGKGERAGVGEAGCQEANSACLEYDSEFTDDP